MRFRTPVSAVNVFTKSLLDGGATTDQLRAIQRKRKWPVRIIQTVQSPRPRNRSAISPVL